MSGLAPSAGKRVLLAAWCTCTADLHRSLCLCRAIVKYSNAFTNEDDYDDGESDSEDDDEEDDDE